MTLTDSMIAYPDMWLTREDGRGIKDDTIGEYENAGIKNRRDCFCLLDVQGHHTGVLVHWKLHTKNKGR